MSVLRMKDVEKLNDVELVNKLASPTLVGRRVYRAKVKPALRNLGFKHDPSSVVVNNDGKWTLSMWKNDVGQAFMVEYSLEAYVNSEGFTAKAHRVTRVA